MTRDDFIFWLDENGLPIEEYPRDTRFIALQFIELGMLASYLALHKTYHIWKQAATT